MSGSSGDNLFSTGKTQSHKMMTMMLIVQCVCGVRSSFMQGLVYNQFTKLRRLKVSSVKNTPSSPEIKAGACDNH